MTICLFLIQAVGKHRKGKSALDLDFPTTTDLSVPQCGYYRYNDVALKLPKKCQDLFLEDLEKASILRAWGQNK
jgi:hypothetical protein